MKRILKASPLGLALAAFGWMAACGSNDTAFDSGTSGGTPFPTDCSNECTGGLCDPQIGCVDCLANADCKDASHPICVVGSCRACGSKADCGAGQSCSPLNHECVTSCTSSTTCPDAAQICDATTGACVQCLANTDCAGGPPLCDPTLGRCVDCLQNSDCGAAAPICDIAAGHCVLCVLDAQCPVGQVCNDHECNTPPAPCTSDATCGGESPHCNTTTGECVACLINSQCTDAGRPLCAPNGACVQCLTNTDCGTTGTCDNFECHGG